MGYFGTSVLFAAGSYLLYAAQSQGQISLALNDGEEGATLESSHVLGFLTSIIPLPLPSSSFRVCLQPDVDIALVTLLRVVSSIHKCTRHLMNREENAQLRENDHVQTQSLRRDCSGRS